MNKSLILSPLAVAIATTTLSTTTPAEGLVLEEVVVTAQKRAESLQEVPISVSAVGGEKLAEAGIENLQDLSAYVPNLKIVEGGIVPQLHIRGIGSGANQGFEQSVGTYSDGVYMGRSMQSRSSFLDLERVEVLRGPQSILFGQSSIAGAISLVSAKPTDEFEAMISGNYGSKYDETEITAYVSGPLTDKLKARLAVRDRQEDGYLENPLLNTDGPALDEQAVRVTLDWDATKALNATLKLETARIDRDNGRPGQVSDAGVYPIASGAPLQDNTELDLKQWSNEDNLMSFESDAAVLNLSYELGNGLTLTSISAYAKYDYREDNYDPEASEVQVVALDMREAFDQFSQEIRLTSPGGETVDYILGAFYQASEQEYQEVSSTYVSNLGLEPAPGFPAFDSLGVRPFTQESDTWALFAQATWNITEALHMTFGLRYTDDEKQGTRSQDTYSLSIAPGVLQSLIPLGPITVADALALNDDGDASPLPDGFSSADHRLSGKHDKTNWTPSVNVQYDITPDIMLYATYTTGYKAGGYDARGINGFYAGATDAFGRAYSTLALGGENFEFDQEEAETFEVGAKMTLLDGSAELNAAFFLTDYTDMQVSIYDGTFGFNVFNAGEATVRGMELDGRWRPSQNLLLTAGVAYLDFEWTENSEASCPGEGVQVPSPSGSGNCDNKGRENLQTPEWTANLSASHTLPIGETLEFRTTLDASFKDNHYTTSDLDNRGEQAGTTLYNVRMALASSDDIWQVALVGKNLTDERIMNYGLSLSLGKHDIVAPAGGRVTQVNRPRTIALEGSYRF